MDANQKFWIALWTIVATGIVLTALVLCTSIRGCYRDMAVQGYEEQTLPGQSGTSWVKAK